MKTAAYILTKYSFMALAIALELTPFFISAAVMQSGSYRIQTDSINFGGGRSISDSYTMEDTLGELGSGYSSSTTYQMNAGYQSMQAVYIAITNSSDITLPNVGGISGGSSTGESSWNVTTDNLAGYSLSVSAGTSPALKASNAAVEDYAPASSVPDYDFSVGNSSSAFGFSPQGADLIQRYKDNGSVCGTGTNDTADKCWDSFSTSPTLIAQSAGSNHPNGTNTTLKYQVGIGNDKIQEAGEYTATITVTALAL